MLVSSYQSSQSLGSSSKIHQLSRFAGPWALVLGSIVFFLSPFLNFEFVRLNAVDFKTVYGSSRCLIYGCNPYSSEQIKRQYASGGGDVSIHSDLSAFLPFQALYPPSSLFLVAPFSLLQWNTAILIWVALSGAIFVTAAFLTVDLCNRWSPTPLVNVLIGMFVATSTMLLTTAQPSGPAIGLCVIGVWSILQKRLPCIGIACFALSIALKPQIGAPVLLYFLLSDGIARRRSWQIVGLALLLCVPGILIASAAPASSDWPHDLRTNLVGTSARGNMNDPGPHGYNAPLVTDLQSVLSLFRDTPGFYGPATWAIVGTLLIVWAYVAMRATPSSSKDVLGVAAIACLGLLPVYHRHYDVRLLLLTFPAVAMLVKKGGPRGAFAVIFSIAIICGSHPTFIREHLHLHQESLGPLKTALLLRTSPLLVLLCGVFYLYCFTRTMRSSETSMG